MNRRKSIQITSARRSPGPVTSWGGSPSRDPALEDRRPDEQTVATSTGSPTTSSAMKIVRRDQSISPSDRSKTRKQTTNPAPGGVRASARTGSVGVGAISFTRYLEDGLQVVVGRRDFVDRARIAARGHFGQPRVERVRLAGLDDDRARLELEAPHVVVRRGTRARAPADPRRGPTRCADARR